MKRIKCYWCGQNALAGMHPSCWESLKGFALDDRQLIPAADTIAPRNLNRVTQSTDSAGRKVVYGRVLPTTTGNE